MHQVLGWLEAAVAPTQAASLRCKALAHGKKPAQPFLSRPMYCLSSGFALSNGKQKLKEDDSWRSKASLRQDLTCASAVQLIDGQARALRGISKSCLQRVDNASRGRPAGRDRGSRPGQLPGNGLTCLCPKIRAPSLRGHISCNICLAGSTLDLFACSNRSKVIY